MPETRPDIRPDLQDELSVRKEGDVTIVRFRDRKIIEELHIQRIGERLSDLVMAERAPRLLLDFTGVEHLSSAALSVLITLNRQVDQRGGQLVLSNIHPQIYEVFKITRLNKVFRIESTPDAALKAFS
jgi:anti-sigma B factor antagonist